MSGLKWNTVLLRIAHHSKKTVDKFSLILVPISASWVSSLSSDVCVFRFCAQANYKNRSFDKQGKDIGHEVVV